ncbi:type II toxin-antitoxin system VapC family toxin [Aminobacter niigataensis]|uniref:Ribonuclease VapC n=1 Tax=Aminobacter niigataensis TaxID=83265 RepID=A0ABR6L749_9HYPH|nr:type II toxin-antitoxin system VapC family toxin [Aminobacter niigataensis]MBB4652629.1 ribonuclease VapC [Aminobacter niigataensis]CAI2936410.1 Ribonuclease VapC [Aminobacter niigataensis]
MIVDASAILAILLEESDGDAMEDKLLSPRQRHAMSPVNYLEAAVKADGLKDTRKGAELNNLLADFGIEIVVVTPEQALLAREAYQQFGKGNHPAKLNLGDCFAYALAKARREPLLFKGDDFRMTDIEAAI